MVAVQRNHRNLTCNRCRAREEITNVCSRCLPLPTQPRTSKTQFRSNCRSARKSAEPRVSSAKKVKPCHGPVHVARGPDQPRVEKVGRGPPCVLHHRTQSPKPRRSLAAWCTCRWTATKLLHKPDPGSYSAIPKPLLLPTRQFFSF
jgi:hypothetical protein